MSKVADSIRRGLEEAVQYAKGDGDLSAYRVHIPEKVDVKAIRKKLGMTQQEFARGYNRKLCTAREEGGGIS